MINDDVIHIFLGDRVMKAVKMAKENSINLPTSQVVAKSKSTHTMTSTRNHNFHRLLDKGYEIYKYLI